ncbi:MAG: hypothetical protein EP297_08010 [Gammaproteobacteria bacterium]|nr:MAG: hypothetical protein EP297_08010 [Gammaproteobacteria bacterium]
MPSETSLFMEEGRVHSYAIRRVNPFLGVLQVIETTDGRAVTANGVVWDIEVRTEIARGWGSLNRGVKEVAYYRYGLWSESDGLVKRPLAPHLDSDPLTHQCRALIERIEERMQQLPFQLIDNFELWLFDSDDRQPLALLASSISANQLSSPEPKYWKSSIGLEGVPSQRRYPASYQLETMVKARAGFNIKKHWFVRRNNGDGVRLDNKQMMKSSDFPVFLLTSNWPDAEQAKVVGDYFEWISPSLLTLQRMSRNEREHVENKLSIQAISVEHHWHLYPEVIDKKILQTARVQCRLQKTNTFTENVQ